MRSVFVVVVFSVILLMVCLTVMPMMLMMVHVVLGMLLGLGIVCVVEIFRAAIVRTICGMPKMRRQVDRFC